GVSYIDTTTNEEHQVRARIVILAASCCESARLLLNSKSSLFPDGLANSSGVVGRYLTDSTGLSVRGFIPALQDLPRYNSDGTGGMHLYVPWWGDNKALGFPRGYHIELGGGFGMPGYGFGSGIETYPQSQGGGYGVALKEEYRRYYGAFVSFAGRARPSSRSVARGAGGGLPSAGCGLCGARPVRCAHPAPAWPARPGGAGGTAGRRRRLSQRARSKHGA